MIDKQIVIVLDDIRYAILEDIAEIAWDDKEESGTYWYWRTDNVYFHLSNGRMLSFYKEELALETLKDIDEYVASLEGSNVTLEGSNAIK
jgi:hypothetical protein